MLLSNVLKNKLRLFVMLISLNSKLHKKVSLKKKKHKKLDIELIISEQLWYTMVLHYK